MALHLCNGICVHSDLERKRLHHLAPAEDSHSPIDGGIYDTKAGTATYSRLRELADILLKADITAIVDATFIKRSARQQMQQLALEQQVPLIILDFPLDEETLRQRIKLRSGQPGKISEATGDVLDYQLTQEDPLSTAEKRAVISVDPAVEVKQIAEKVKGFAPA